MISQQSITIRELPLDFSGKGESRGHDYKQVFTDSSWYIYQVLIAGKPSHYEVFKRTVILANNSRYSKENYVRYPRSTSFGKTAWTAKTMEQAKEIIKRH